MHMHMHMHTHMHTHMHMHTHTHMHTPLLTTRTHTHDRITAALTFTLVTLLTGVAVQDVAIAELMLQALREPRGRL